MTARFAHGIVAVTSGTPPLEQGEGGGSNHGNQRQWAAVEWTGVHRGTDVLQVVVRLQRGRLVWLVARLWLGWEWLQAGWSKLFGGNITWKVWNWGDPAYSLTGDGNIGWIRAGTVKTPDGTRTLQVGDAVAGFAKGALASGTAGDHPDIAYSWYVNWLEWLRDTGHTFFGPLVAVGEVVIGICLILGLFTGIMAFLGTILNFSFVFAGSAGVNPAMILVGGLLILAWRNAGWYGLDRFVLPRLGTPWHRGELLDRRRSATGSPTMTT